MEDIKFLLASLISSVWLISYLHSTGTFQSLFSAGMALLWSCAILYMLFKGG